MFRFITVFLVMLVVLFVAELTPIVEHWVIEPFTGILAHASAWLIDVFEPSTISMGKRIQNADGSFIVSIERGCNGIEAVIILISAIIAFPAPWKHRLIGLVAGFIAIQLLNLVRIPENVPAVQVTTDRVIDPLRAGTEIMLWLALLIIVISLVTGPYPWAVSLRARVASLFSMAAGSAKDPATAEWVLDHRDALQWVGAGVAVLALWFFSLSWLTFFALLIVVGLYELAVVRLAERAAPASAPSS